jgi:hypothetical protein
VIAYAVFDGKRTLAGSYIYNWDTSWIGSGPDVGNISWQTAQSYWSMAAVPGFSFGSNVGAFCYQDRTQWTIQGLSWIKKNTTDTAARLTGSNNGLTVVPGDTLYWDHELRNAGPQRMDRNITVGVARTAAPTIAGLPAVAATTSPYVSVATNNVQPGVLFYTAYNQTLSASPFHTQSEAIVLQSDVGRQLCQYIYGAPGNTAGSTITSTAACATVPYDFEIFPDVDLPQTTVTGPGPLPNTGSITNPSTSVTKSKPTEWRKSLIIVPPTNNDVEKYPSSGQRTGTGIEPCIGTTGGFYGGPGIMTCQTIASGTGVEVLPNDQFSNAVDAQVTNDYELGTKICIAMSVRPRSSTADDWAHAIRCAIAGKKPKVEVWGSGIMVGRSASALIIQCGEITVNCSQISGSITNKPGMVYGSWSEYGLYAPNTIAQVASASGLIGGNALAGQKDWSSYTFNNAGITSTPAFGEYISGNARLPDITTLFPESDASTAGDTNQTQTWNVGSLSGNIKPQEGVTQINLTGGGLVSGQWAVLNAPNATVTITGDIVYDGSELTDISQIPQLVIRAKEINIAGGVSRVDAWLLAPDGATSTCSDRGTASQLSVAGGYTNSSYNMYAGDCNVQLRINGPVVASKLYLRRTYGSQASQGGDASSGEIINLRPDAYMWANMRAKLSPVIRSTMITEVPPRY